MGQGNQPEALAEEEARLELRSERNGKVGSVMDWGWKMIKECHSGISSQA